MGILAQVEQFAYRREFTKTRPVSDALRELRGIAKPKVRTFSKDDVLALLKAAEIRGKWVAPRQCDMMRCFANVAAFCGLRWGEIAGLRHEFTDLESGVIKVRHSLSDDDGLKGPKTKAGIRDVPMPAHVRAMLRDWIARHAIANPDGLLFTTVNGTPLASTNFHRGMWYPLLSRAGLDDDPTKRRHFHALRHFASSMMIDMGLSMPDTAGILGHESFDTTLQVYAHSLVRGHQRREVMDAMADRLLKAPTILTLKPVATSA